MKLRSSSSFLQLNKYVNFRLPWPRDSERRERLESIRLLPDLPEPAFGSRKKRGRASRSFLTLLNSCLYGAPRSLNLLALAFVLSQTLPHPPKLLARQETLKKKRAERRKFD